MRRGRMAWDFPGKAAIESTRFAGLAPERTSEAASFPSSSARTVALFGPNSVEPPS